MIRRIIFVFLGIILAAVVAVLGLAASKPDMMEVQRTLAIKAPPEKIYPLLEDFQKFATWSPWEKLDPAMQRQISTPPNGKGASYSWAGNSEVGKGRMEITDTVPNSKVTMRLDFQEPFEASNVTAFDLAPKGDMTEVTWSMRGQQPFIAKVMDVLMGIDSLIGKDFERGLANIKTLAESG